MLVLSRKTEESVVVGGCNGFQRMLKVTVLEITGRKVRLGFDVDPSVPVHRAEVWEQICTEGLEEIPTHDARLQGLSNG
jgi:carbon storage regulator CsrA